LGEKDRHSAWRNTSGGPGSGAAPGITPRLEVLGKPVVVIE
jgi:hypothetical protein